MATIDFYAYSISQALSSTPKKSTVAVTSRPDAVTCADSPRIMQLEFSRSKPRRLGTLAKRLAFDIREDELYAHGDSLVGEHGQQADVAVSRAAAAAAERGGGVAPRAGLSLLSRPAKRGINMAKTIDTALSPCLDEGARHGLSRSTTPQHTQPANARSTSNYRAIIAEPTPNYATSLRGATTTSARPLSAPRRTPLLPSRYSSNIPARDVPGANTGKENVPPGLEPEQLKAKHVEQSSKPAQSTLIAEPTIVHVPVRSASTSNRSVSKLPRRVHHASRSSSKAGHGKPETALTTVSAMPRPVTTFDASPRTGELPLSTTPCAAPFVKQETEAVSSTSLNQTTERALDMSMSQDLAAEAPISVGHNARSVFAVAEVTAIATLGDETSCHSATLAIGSASCDLFASALRETLLFNIVTSCLSGSGLTRPDRVAETLLLTWSESHKLSILHTAIANRGLARDSAMGNPLFNLFSAVLLAGQHAPAFDKSNPLPLQGAFRRFKGLIKSQHRSIVPSLYLDFTHTRV